MSQPIKDDTVFDKGLYLDFILDVLHGCKWSCAGCGVDKAGQKGWGGEFGPQTVELMKEFKSKTWVTDHLEIGPTDFLSASNTFEILYDPNIQELTRIFNSTLFQTTFLSRDFKKAAKAINETFDRDQVINFFVVIDPVRIGSDRYLETIVENRDRFLDAIHVKANPIPHPLFNAFSHSSGFGSDFVEKHRKIRKIWGRGAYHTFSCGRSFEKDQERVLKVVDWLNENFNRFLDRDNFEDMNFYYGGKGRDGFSKHYRLRNGQWSHVPILYSPFVNEYPEFHIPMEENWSVQAFEEFERQLLVEQLGGLEGKPECENCFHNYMCAQYGILRLQDAFGVNRCIVPRKAIERSWSPRQREECKTPDL